MPLAIGMEVHYSFGRKGKGRRREGVGRVTKVRKVDGFIFDIAKNESKGPVFEVQVKPNDGGRAFWSPGMADDKDGTLAKLCGEVRP